MNYLSFELGGEKRGLKFNMTTLEIVEEHFQKEPLNLFLGLSFSNLKEIKEPAFMAFYAALIANCRAKKVDPDFTENQARQWFDNDLHPADFIKVVNAYNGPTNEQSANGEVGNEKPITFQGA